jgi:hypothetical protein
MIGEQKDSTLVLGSITGYRVWNIPSWDILIRDLSIDWDRTPWGKHSRLYSINDYIWKVSSNKAYCRMQRFVSHKHKHDHTESPKVGCHCGFYGFYDSENVIRCFAGETSIVYGAFTAWGNTILGTIGFRSQYAKISALIARTPYHTSMITHIAGYYGVPVFHNYGELLLKFPKTDLSNILT